MSFRPPNKGYKIKLTESEIARKAIGAFELITGREHRELDPSSFLMSPDRFMEYLAANGITHFLGNFEPLRPHQPKYLPENTLLLPQEERAYPLMLLLLAIGDMLRNGLGVPVYCRNIYRPGPDSLLWDGSKPGDYNKWAGGKANGDHPSASAADFDIIASKQRMPALIAKAKLILKPILTANVNLLPTSVGFGSYFVHIGLFAPETLRLGANRRWSY